MRAIGAWVVCAAVLAAGCGEGPRSDKAKKEKAGDKAKGALAIEGLPEEETILNGKSARWEARLSWSVGFAEPVQLTASVEPAERGVRAEVEPATADPRTDKKAAVVVTVGEAAASGDYKVTVAGKAAGGSREVTVKVPKKE
jgi:hypothetical protein